MPEDHAHANHPAIATRLKRAEGHLRRVIGMIDEGRPCLDVNAGVKLSRGAAQNWATLGLRETSARERRPVSRALHVAGG